MLKYEKPEEALIAKYQLRLTVDFFHRMLTILRFVVTICTNKKLQV